MTPLKAKSLIGKTSELTGIPEEACKAVIESFYKDLRASLSNLEHKQIIVEHFGVFYCKERTLDKYEKKHNNIIAYMEKKPNSFRTELIMRNSKEELEKITRIKNQYREDKERREFFFLHKNKIKEQELKNEENTRNLEE